MSILVAIATRTKSRMASYYIQRKKYHTTQPRTAMVVTEDPPLLSVLRRSLDPLESMGLAPTIPVLPHPRTTLQENAAVSDCVMPFMIRLR